MLPTTLLLDCLARAPRPVSSMFHAIAPKEHCVKTPFRTCGRAPRAAPPKRLFTQGGKEAPATGQEKGAVVSKCSLQRHQCHPHWSRTPWGIRFLPLLEPTCGTSPRLSRWSRGRRPISVRHQACRKAPLCRQHPPANALKNPGPQSKSPAARTRLGQSSNAG